MKAKEFVTETINPDCFNPAFNDTQHFDGLTYRATVEEEYGKPVLTVKVLDDNFQQAGLAKFKPSKAGVVSLITSFRPEYQGQGLARNIYAYVRALGNTIVPSRNQLPAGRAMWDSWKKSGDAKHLMRDVAEGLDPNREAAKTLQNLKNLALMKSALTFQQLRQAGRESMITDAIKACMQFEQSYLQNKQQGNAVFVRALRDEIDNFSKGIPINSSMPDDDGYAPELGDLLQGKLGKLNFQQGVAENNHWHAAGVADAQRDVKRDPDRKVKKLNPRTRLKTMQYKQARHPEEAEQYSLGYRSINPAESICSLEEAHEIFDDFEQAMAERGLTEDAFDTVTDEQIVRETAAWRRKAGKSAKGGLNRKGVASYRRENPGSKLQMAVTTKPSKLKPGSKAAKRRKSFCARMSGVKGPMKKPNGKPTRKALALRKWNC